MRAATKAVHLMGGKFNRAKTRHLVTSLSAVSQRWYEVNTAGELEVTGECPKATRLSKQTGDAYLGTTVTHTADMRPQALAAHKATRANLSRVGSIASTYGRHDPGITKIVLHQAYSYLLFGAEVWATKHDALHNGTLQAVAHTAARALDMPRRTSRAFLLGGTWSPCTEDGSVRCEDHVLGRAAHTTGPSLPTALLQDGPRHLCSR